MCSLAPFTEELQINSHFSRRKPQAGTFDLTGHTTGSNTPTYTRALSRDELALSETVATPGGSPGNSVPTARQRPGLLLSQFISNTIASDTKPVC